MKHISKVLAFLLAVSMLLSCLATASAAQLLPDKTATEESPSALNVGAFSQSFKATNIHQYADTDTVRAIVILESPPEADYEGTVAQKSVYRLRLNKEHTAVKRAMSGISYTPAYEFTTLLNGFSCDVAYGDLESIAKISGVSAVYIANHYAEPRPEKPENNYANQIIGNTVMNSNGFKGEGIVVAVLDTGLRTSHEAFKVYSSMPITSTLTSSSISKASVKAKYVSAKIPFAYDYADKDNDVSDQNGHGTHVSGTAVGYAASSDGALIMSGGAPAAQLVSMKIFKDAGGGTSSDIYFSALEDCYTLGVDVVNMSIGAQNGFTYDSSLETDVFGNIYKRMEQAGIVMCVAAGNEYSMAEFSSIGYIGSEYTDFGTVASPATYEGNISVAAVQNSNYPTYTMSFNGGSFSFIDTCSDGTHGWIKTFGGKSTSVVVLKTSDGKDLAYGTEADYASVNVKSKIVVVSRGEISFQEKMDFAANAGAVGIIVCNNSAGSISMSIDPYAIPAVSVDLSVKETFLSASSTAKLTTPTQMTYVDNPNAYLMCDFSNWGTSPMLTIDPTISSIGGMVYSAVPTSDTAYEVMSGTSMACPNAAGTFACLLQAVRAAGRASNTSGSRTGLTKIQSMEKAISLMESTGIILQDADDYVYSVRRQGSGLANSANSTVAYLYGAYISNPIQELGDDKNKTGVYTMDLTLVNDGYEEVTYDNFNAYILYDDIGGSDTGYTNFLRSGLLYAGNKGSATITYKVSGKEVTSITLKPSETKTVTVTITLANDIREYYDKFFPNGTYVEGYISFSNTVAEGDTSAAAVETHATFLAYYGDWLKAPALENLSTFEYLRAIYALNNEIYENGKTYAESGFSLTDVLIKKFGPFYTDMNTIYTIDSNGDPNSYLGANLLDAGNTPYSSAYHAFSTPNTNAAASDAVGILIYPRLLRNARAVKLTIKDKNTGTVYHSEQANYIPKDRYEQEDSMWTPHVGFDWKGTKSDGKTYVSSGTVATVSLDILLPYGESSNTWQTNALKFDVTVDYTAPTIKSAVYDSSKQLVSVTASDAQYLASIILCSSDYQTLHAKKTFAPSAVGESCTAIFDVSGISNKNLVAVAFDYATNQISKTVTSGTVTADPTDPTEPPETTEPTEPTTPTEPEEPTTDTYKLVTSASDLTSGDYLVMATATGSYAGNYGYYIMTTTKDDTYAAMQSSGQNFNSLPGGLTLNTSASSKYVWTISGNANGFTMMTSGGSYLTGVSGKTSLSLSSSGSTWKGSYTSSKNGFLLSANSRYLALRDDIETIGDNGTPLFVTNSSSSGVTVYMHLYKKQVTATCSHSNTSTSTTPATCTENGKTVVTCKDCGATVSTTVIPATGHNPATATIDPTCTESGAIVEYCKTCNSNLSVTTIPATGHSYKAVVTPPTCSAGGYTTYTCVTCRDSYVGDHTNVAEHSYTSVTVAPTCTTPGSVTYTCGACGDTYTTTLPATGHTSATATISPTCTESGAIVEYCKICNTNLNVTTLSATGHSYLYTSNQDGTHTITCKNCSNYTKVEDCTCKDSICIYCGYEDPTPVIWNVQINHSLNLASDISINYAVTTASMEGFTDFYLECVVPNYSGNTLNGTTTVRIDPILNGRYYYFTMDGLLATQMNNVIRSTLYGYKDGKLYVSNVDEYSIAIYAYNQMEKDGNTTALKTLCAELLRYGAKAQIQKNYRTDSLADSSMTTAQNALLSDLDAVTFGNNKVIHDDLSNPTVTWAGRSLILDSKVTLRMILDLSKYTGDREDLSVRVTYVNLEGQTVTETLTDLVVYHEGKSQYAMDFAGLRAAELRTVVTATVYAQGKQVSPTMEYSPDTYGNGRTGDLLILCQALISYSDSALNYFNSFKN